MALILIPIPSSPPLLHQSICDQTMSHQLFDVVVSSDVHGVEEDLGYSPPPRAFLHLVPSLGVLLQIDVHEGHLEVREHLLGPCAERTSRDGKQQNLT